MILCVDPAREERERTETALVDGGFETAAVGSLEEALDYLQRDTDVECLVTEQDLPDGTGLELIHRTRELAPDTACILFTDRSLDEIDTDSFGETVAEYLRKDLPEAHDELLALVEHSLSFLSQTAYPLPENEEARLAALERYADDSEAASESLDRLGELATELFDLDSAAVGLMDAHHEQFLSCYGASFGTLDREKSICTYALLDHDVTVIEDVSADPRFSDNEGLAAAGVAFYAGMPLVTPDGHAIGVFCIHDSEPRTFPERDRMLLKLLATEAMEQLELRRRIREARRGGGDE